MPIDKKLEIKSVGYCKRVIWRRVNFRKQFLFFPAVKKEIHIWINYIRIID